VIHVRARKTASLVLALGLAFGLATLAGCSAASSGAPAATGPAATTAAPAPQAPDAPREPQEAPDAMIARTASIYLVVDDAVQATQGLHDAATSLQGIVTNETVSLPSDADGRRGTASVTLRVPADSLDAALTQIAALGKVTDRQITAEDVTSQVVDVDSRVTTMRESIARLQELMKQSGSVADIASVEAQLTQRQADLEALLAQQKSLSQRVATATITVSVRTVSTTEQPPSTGFFGSLKAGWNALLQAGRVAIVVIGTLLPWLVLAAIIVVPILLVRRHRRRTAPVPAHPAVPVHLPPPTTWVSTATPAGPAEPAPPAVGTAVSAEAGTDGDTPDA